MATTTTPASVVQHVGKRSSDQLLMKFANLDSPAAPKIKSKRRSSESSSALVERRSLLPAAAATRRQLRIARSRLKATDHLRNNRSLFSALHKTWRSTVEGASRVFMEKHYHRHKRLISSDFV